MRGARINVVSGGNRSIYDPIIVPVNLVAYLMVIRVGSSEGERVSDVDESRVWLWGNNRGIRSSIVITNCIKGKADGLRGDWEGVGAGMAVNTYAFNR